MKLRLTTTVNRERERNTPSEWATARFTLHVQQGTVWAFSKQWCNVQPMYTGNGDIHTYMYVVQWRFNQEMTYSEYQEEVIHGTVQSRWGTIHMYNVMYYVSIIFIYGMDPVSLLYYGFISNATHTPTHSHSFFLPRWPHWPKPCAYMYYLCKQVGLFPR